MTRPNELPSATVAADTQNKEGSDGRYSGGNHNRFDPLKVIQEESSLKPNPYNPGWVKQLALGPAVPVDSNCEVHIF